LKQQVILAPLASTLRALDHCEIIRRAAVFVQIFPFGALV